MAPMRLHDVLAWPVAVSLTAVLAGISLLRKVEDFYVAWRRDV